MGMQHRIIWYRPGWIAAIVVCAIDIQCFCNGIESTEWMSVAEDM